MGHDTQLESRDRGDLCLGADVAVPIEHPLADVTRERTCRFSRPFPSSGRTSRSDDTPSRPTIS